MLFQLSLLADGAYLFTPVSTGESLTALWSADFISHVYTLNNSPAVVGDLFTQNTDWGSFNSATDITGAGLVGLPVCSAAAKALVLNGATYVITFSGVDIGSSGGIDVIDLPDFNSDVGAQFILDSSVQLTLTPSPTHHISTSNTAALGINKIALTLTPTHCAVSLNGSDVVELNTFPDPALTGLTDVGINGNSSTPIRSIVAYETQSDVSLPTLSAP